MRVATITNSIRSARPTTIRCLVSSAASILTASTRQAEAVAGRVESSDCWRLTADVERWKEEQNRRVKELEARLAQATDQEAKKAIEAELKLVREAKPPFDSALAVTENGPTAPVTHVLYRGDVNSPREEVSAAFPAVFGLEAPQLPVPTDAATSSGRRRALADWIASPQNPLTARV